MAQWFERLERQPKAQIALGTLALTAVIGILDYVTDTRISLSAFYLLPVAAAAWFVGPSFAVLVSILSVVSWIGGDLAVGRHFESLFILCWNAAVQLTSYFALVVALASLRALQRGLEARVRQRALALTREIAAREQLERELLEVSEREQRRIGQDLHDGLCQHLAATALAGQVLGERLAAQDLPEARDAANVVALVEDGIALSRRLAKGLHPVELDADGLMQALQEFASTTSDLFRVSCRFECDTPVLIHDTATAAHMYRIAQEAVGNAVKHGKAANVAIQLTTLEDGHCLQIVDDGIGLPQPTEKLNGMGLRIMAHRSEVIGAMFEVRCGETGGTIVSCMLPSEPLAEERVS